MALQQKSLLTIVILTSIASSILTLFVAFLSIYIFLKFSRSLKNEIEYKIENIVDRKIEYLSSSKNFVAQHIFREVASKLGMSYSAFSKAVDDDPKEGERFYDCLALISHAIQDRISSLISENSENLRPNVNEIIGNGFLNKLSGLNKLLNSPKVLDSAIENKVDENIEKFFNKHIPSLIQLTEHDISKTRFHNAGSGYETIEHVNIKCSEAIESIELLAQKSNITLTQLTKDIIEGIFKNKSLFSMEKIKKSLKNSPTLSPLHIKSDSHVNSPITDTKTFFSLLNNTTDDMHECNFYNTCAIASLKKPEKHTLQNLELSYNLSDATVNPQSLNRTIE